MTDDEAARIMSALDDLLEAERAALLDGDLDRMPALLGEKAALVEDLNTLDPGDRPAMGALREKVSRNQALLDGALQGIRQVAGRVAALRQLQQSFDTYDESGRRRTIEGDVVRRFEKRA